MKAFVSPRKAIYILSIFFLVIVSSVYAAEDSMYWGQWATKKNTRPNIKIDIKRGKRTKVVINGKEKKMKYHVVAGEYAHRLIEFHQETYGKKPMETHYDIYLISGRVDNKFALTGFYEYEKYNTEGVGYGGKIVPITLYRIKEYDWDD